MECNSRVAGLLEGCGLPMCMCISTTPFMCSREFKNVAVIYEARYFYLAVVIFNMCT